MKNPTTVQSQAIEHLQRHAQAWSGLLGWLTESHARALEECARADDELAVRRLQGEVRALHGLIGTLTPKK
ncbi:hypothetical protein [Paraburkholderia antibiotica]|uniref:Uncharacterized protein n=1 Tax=Paraburkholderia antibiotica TaxID=2728839 RepID=A0A7Y0FFY3_9BURK|nr:hypothetical protein [Paraburkholderia antibiotica]NML34520.1 hypothetical protein [Paraburkholderia antibiotica]